MAIEPTREDYGRRVTLLDHENETAYEGIFTGYSGAYAYVNFERDRPAPMKTCLLTDLDWTYPRVIEKDRSMELVPKYPQVHIELTKEDGNAFNILGKVSKLLRSVGCDDKEVNRFFTEATAKDYDHLLRTAMRWVNVT